MPRKPRNNTKTTRRKPRRRKKNVRVSRVVKYTLGFILFLSLSLYGLYYIKNQISSEDSQNIEHISGVNTEIAKVDNVLTNALFKAGISSQNIISKKVQKRKKGELSWEYRDLIINVPRDISSQNIINIINKSFSDAPDVEELFNPGKNTLTVDLQYNKIKTHRIKFNFDSTIAAKTKDQKPEPQNEKEEIVSEKVVDTPKEEEHKAVDPKRSESLKTTETKRGDRAKIVIVVDDLGLDKAPIDGLLNINMPLTFAVLPGLPYSKYAAQKAHKKGWDVILHLPMEPKESSGYTAADAGDGALLVGQPKQVIRSNLDKNLSAVPHLKGVNNHMGSKFMENEELMELVLDKVRKRGLYFLDSKTSSKSIGYETASKMGIKTASRDVFLDNVKENSSYVRAQVMKLVRIAEKNGYAVGICHPYSDTVDALTEILPKISDRVQVVSLSSVVHYNNKKMGMK